MANKFVRITIDVELEKDVEDLLAKASARVHTIQGVANAFEVAVEDIVHSDILESVDFMKERASWKPFAWFLSLFKSKSE